jgi:hypothetical protein
MKKIYFIVGFLALALFLTPRVHAQGVDFEFEEVCLAGDTFHVNAYINSGSQESFKTSAAEFSWGGFPASAELENVDFLESIVVSKGVPTGKAILGWAEGYDGKKIDSVDRTPFARLTFKKKADLAGILKAKDVRIFGFDDLEDKARLNDTKEFDFSVLEACPEQVAQVDDQAQEPVQNQPVDNQAQQPAVQEPVRPAAPVVQPQVQALPDAVQPIVNDQVVVTAVQQPVDEEEVVLRGSAPQPVQLTGTTQLQQTGPAENALLVLGLAFVWTLYRFRKLAYKFL